MNCPKCGSKMLEFPCLINNPCLEYWLCMDCVIRVIKKCKWMGEATIHSAFNEARGEKPFTFGWCNHPKLDGPCNPTSDKKTGYIFCPQIREWQEKSASWVAKTNREFEEKYKEQRRLFFAKCKRIFDATKVKNGKQKGSELS